MSQDPAAPSEATSPLITIDVWADVVCPWCYIGESRLHDAIEAEGLTGRVHLRAHSFELDPTSPTDSVQDNIAHLVEAKGMPEEKVREMEAQIQEMAREMGREYVTGRPIANTRAVHRVMQALGEARGIDAATAYFLELQRGYFTGTADPFAPGPSSPARSGRAWTSRSPGRPMRGGRMTRRSRPRCARPPPWGRAGCRSSCSTTSTRPPVHCRREAFRQALRQIAEEARGAGTEA